MNIRPIELAHDADLRYSSAALHRAALRARELAMKTGTAIVIIRDGKLENIVLNTPTGNAHQIQASPVNHSNKT